MSQPNIPNISPTINLETLDVIKIILASIGLEELSLAHLINAEAEKVQYALGTLETEIPLPTTGLTFDQILTLNRSVSKFLLATSHKELVLLNKLNESIDLFNEVNEQLATQCTCSGSIVGGSGTTATITLNGTTTLASGGTSFTNTEICPNCNLDASTLNFNFTENPIVGNNDSFTFVADEFNQPSCLIVPGTDTGTLIVTGEGNLTYNATTSRANFSLQLTELAAGPGDNYAIVITSQEDPTFSISISSNLPDAQLEVSDCNG